jgi:hypothetical protein
VAIVVFLAQRKSGPFYNLLFFPAPPRRVQNTHWKKHQHALACGIFGPISVQSQNWRDHAYLKLNRNGRAAG